MKWWLENEEKIDGKHIVCVANEWGYRCGYVGVPKDNPNYGVDYQEIKLCRGVHGGLTFSSQGGATKNLTEKDLWYIGFDCHHYGDRCDETIMSDKYKEYNIDSPQWKVWTADMVLDETRMLAKQL